MNIDEKVDYENETFFFFFHFSKIYFVLIYITKFFLAHKKKMREEYVSDKKYFSLTPTL